MVVKAKEDLKVRHQQYLQQQEEERKKQAELAEQRKKEEEERERIEAEERERLAQEAKEQGLSVDHNQVSQRQCPSKSGQLVSHGYPWSTNLCPRCIVKYDQLVIIHKTGVEEVTSTKKNNNRKKSWQPIIINPHEFRWFYIIL